MIRLLLTLLALVSGLTVETVAPAAVARPSAVGQLPGAVSVVVRPVRVMQSSPHVATPVARNLPLVAVVPLAAVGAVRLKADRARE